MPYREGNFIEEEGERDTYVPPLPFFQGIYRCIYIYISERHEHPCTPKATPTDLTLGAVGLSSVATIRRRRGEGVGSTGCRKQAAAIMRDGRDRVRSIFSISREWSPYYSGEEAVEGSARLFDSRRGLFASCPLSYSSLFLFSLSLSSLSLVRCW